MASRLSICSGVGPCVVCMTGFAFRSVDGTQLSVLPAYNEVDFY